MFIDFDTVTGRVSVVCVCQRGFCNEIASNFKKKVCINAIRTQCSHDEDAGYNAAALYFVCVREGGERVAVLLPCCPRFQRRSQLVSGDQEHHVHTLRLLC